MLVNGAQGFGPTVCSDWKWPEWCIVSEPYRMPRTDDLARLAEARIGMVRLPVECGFHIDYSIPLVFVALEDCKAARKWFDRVAGHHGVGFKRFLGSEVAND
jgi:hypothetical protein